VAAAVLLRRINEAVEMRIVTNESTARGGLRRCWTVTGARRYDPRLYMPRALVPMSFEIFIVLSRSRSEESGSPHGRGP